MSLATAKPFGVGNWKLEEGAGSARVDAINGVNLAEINGTTANTTGKFGNAALIVAADSRWLRTLTTPVNHSAQTSKFMIRAWVKLASLTNGVVVAKWGDTGNLNREWLLQYSSGAARFQFLTFDWNDSSNKAVVANNFGPPATGVLYLIHAWFDPTGSPDQIGISVNAGTPDTLNHSGNTGMTAGPNPLIMGAFQFGGNPSSIDDVSGFFDGAIDDLVILKGYALDAAERTADYNGGTGVEFSAWDAAATVHNLAASVALSLTTAAALDLARNVAASVPLTLTAAATLSVQSVSALAASVSLVLTGTGALAAARNLAASAPLTLTATGALGPLTPTLEPEMALIHLMLP